MYRNRLKINIRYLYKNNKLANSTKWGNVKEKHIYKKTSCPTNEDTIINDYYIGRLNNFSWHNFGNKRINHELSKSINFIIKYELEQKLKHKIFK